LQAVSLGGVFGFKCQGWEKCIYDTIGRLGDVDIERFLLQEHEQEWWLRHHMVGAVMLHFHKTCTPMYGGKYRLNTVVLSQIMVFWPRSCFLRATGFAVPVPVAKQAAAIFVSP